MAQGEGPEFKPQYHKKKKKKKKSLVLSLALLVGHGNFLEVGLSERFQIIGVTPSKGIVRFWSLLSLFPISH
jgi:hypothetical protein